MVIFDTDILIWTQRGNKKAADLIDKADQRYLSILSFMELMQCPQSKAQQKITHDFLREFNFKILPLTENIGHRAFIYIEQYSLRYGIRIGDAIIAATAAEHNLTLISSNQKHFKPIVDLDFKVFKP